MRIKVQDKWFDSDEEPLCVQFSKKDLENLKNAEWPENVKHKYATFPDHFEMTQEECSEWMDE